MKTLIPILITIAALLSDVFSQEIPGIDTVNRNDALSIYLDCNYCDFDYFRTSFTEVNYVNERQDADVHIMVNELTNGSGGSQFDIIFKGLGRYASHTDTLVFNVPGNATEEEIRHSMLENVQLGLVPYLTKTGSKSRMSLFFADSPEVTEEKDPWRNWMFEISGQGSYFRTKSSTDLTLLGNLYVSKITPEVKFESSNVFMYYSTNLTLYDDDMDTVVFHYDMIQRSYSSYNQFVKSLGEHVGLGGDIIFLKSDYRNLKYQFTIGPKVEVNLFKYSEASRRQFRISYAVAYEHSAYNELTVNNKLKDDMFCHSLKVRFSYYETWGTLSSVIGASGYLNDFNQFAVGATNSASVNVGKGLSFFVNFGASYTQNQIYLQQADPELEEFLTGQREMYSDFNYDICIGVAYRFGSIYNNAVNPRFGP